MQQHIASSSLLLVVLAITLIYALGVVFYRLFYHPLAKFPGPRIAAATYLYEIAFDYFGHGAYLFEIERMHEKYGPVVRVNPKELSIKDGEFYDKVYVNGNVRRTEALPSFGDGMDFNHSHGMTVDHHHHRMRRKPLEPFFSRAGVARFEPNLASVVMTLVHRLRGWEGTGTVLRLDHAFAALAGDIISTMCIESPSMSFLEDRDFAPDWYNLFHTLITSMPIFMNFPWIIKAVRLIPTSILKRVDPRSQMFRDWRDMSVAEIEKSLRRKANKEVSTYQRGTLKAPTLFDHLVNSDLPSSEMSVERLASEAQVILGAGTVTTAQSMSHLVVNILLRPEVENRLREELATLMKHLGEARLPEARELEKLPYLQACIKEGLRLSHGLMHRLPRIAPDVALDCNGWIIPPGTPVGMSAYLMHMDDSVYSNPKEFVPERWLGEPDPKMERNYVPFSRGSRRCLAPNLAYAEISMVMAALFSPWSPKIRLYETNASDVDPVCAFLLPLPRLDSKGVRVIVEESKDNSK
ncbi:uncharacterized protein MYCFIDRAFT_130725 [Pseudocercospora fijiensis CIRAD86]|uniref:Cytochrome P450 monooxygenase n=1 Tax=Pseudocercospora fijiensis (strain CIRAD86) TaxID=383855 RepID=M3AR97_PSEFD|nr:uncharacterized protein MYCFIDRAFT_130725 [Pseudocercospora fijiensis CIRAD86]EME87126.1 hypothetical protein MYCFIDRAFT_130725 [Pseudocercospora fijiensis CIRAD86]